MEAGTYAYGLNIALPAVLDSQANNVKRVMRDFRITSVQCALAREATYDDGFSVILGTDYEDWFADYVICANLFGDGSLPHPLPADGIIVPRGRFIVVKAINNDTTAKRIALLFQGEHL